MKATTWSLGPFRKERPQNLLPARSGSRFICPFRGDLAWESKDVFNPAAVFAGERHWLIYRAEDHAQAHAGTSRLGLAWSRDGLKFSRHPAPVLFPRNDRYAGMEWPGGCEDPRVTGLPGGAYVMTYTAFNGRLARLCVATSKDLRTWKKLGPAFQGMDAKRWSKSGSIVSALNGKRLQAVKLNGWYYMYYGESDICLARSRDALRWQPLVSREFLDRRLLRRRGAWQSQDRFGPMHPMAVLKKRDTGFDSKLCEPGPPALLTKHGILLIYNGSDKRGGSYSCGQALFDEKDPATLIARCEKPFLSARSASELKGQMKDVVFSIGLTLASGRARLYYGAADSGIRCASASYPKGFFKSVRAHGS